jgi:hypothetical protein
MQPYQRKLLHCPTGNQTREPLHIDFDALQKLLDNEEPEQKIAKIPDDLCWHVDLRKTPKSLAP